MTSDPFADLQIPESLQESMQRHREHLARLVTTMKSIGMAESQIEESVSIIVQSYKEELLRAIKMLVR